MVRRADETSSTARDALAERFMLTPEELASLLGVPLATIYGWRSRGEGPAGYRVGRHVRFRTEDVERWLERNRDTTRVSLRRR